MDNPFSAHMDFTGCTAYGAAKGGAIALTKVMAVELAQFGINA